MSGVDLLELARSVAGSARAGEQIEAYAVRSRDVDVNAFEGDVESLATAEIEGVGVRIIVDQRQGYAWAGSLDADVVADTLADARDNAAFGARDEFYGLASPDEFAGIEATELDLWREELLTVPTAEKVALAIELEAATKAIDPRIRGLRSASYGDTAAESAIVTSLGVEVITRRTVCSCSAFAMATDGDETQTGGGFSMGRAFTDLDLDKAAHDAAERSVRLLGATQPRVAPPSRGARPAGHAVADLSDRRRRCRPTRCSAGARCSSGTRAKTSPHRASPSSTTPRSSRRSAPRATTPRVCRRAGSSSSAAAGSTRSCTTCTPLVAAAPRAPGRPCAAGSSRRRASVRVRCTSSPAS